METDAPIPFGALVEPKAPWSERRLETRQRTGGQAIVTIREEGAMPILTPVELLDTSTHGLGIRSEKPAMPGARVRLYFHGEVMPGRTGVVARCDWDGEAWRLGVRCDMRIAA
ncbi:MAG: PilZ domain-containing protein [Phycisphaerales bacterium]